MLFSLILPPLGLVLLWTKRGLEAGKKAIFSIPIAALGVFYGFLIFGSILVTPDPETHYSELERHRAAQRAENPEPASAVEQPSATDTANANASATPLAPAAPAPAGSFRNYWTEFRGPGRAGRYDETPILTSWPSSGLRELWRQPVGEGYSSFTVADGRAFTIEKRRNQEAVAAYDLQTGRELWTSMSNAEFVQSEGDGPRSTPTWDSGRVYALGGTGELRCVDGRTGKLIWSRDTLRENGAQNLQWGQAVSPLVVDDKVIVQPGGSQGKSVVAYNKLTGAPAWKVLNDRQAYTSPMLVTLAGTRQVMIVTANRVVGLDPSNGAMLWEYPWNTQMGINASQPIMVDGNRFFISAGYSKGCALVEVTRSGVAFVARKIWENNMMKNKFNSSVLHDGHIYGLDEGILTCLDVETGVKKWKDGRYRYGQVLLASGHLIVMTEEGDLVLVRANPEKLDEVTRFSALKGRCWNYPAMASGRLLLRNATEMVCYDIAG
jgi:outer membrane protein assembly factor BamB